jgi:putative Mg2+ transporter-C (MgtC) family protein
MPTDGGPGLSQLVFAERVAIAVAFGSIIGLERQWRQRMAGLRTNTLVATGTSLFIMITPLLGTGGNTTQIAAYVVSGIGFLAGGVIFKERMSVTGLNTAATLWCTAAIGVLVGFGFIVEAAIGVVAVLFANVVLRPIVQLVNRRPIDGSEVVTSYEVHAVCRQDVEERVRASMIAAIRAARMSLIAVYSEDDTETQRVEVIADVSVMGQDDARLEKIVTVVGLEPAVYAVSWQIVPTSDEERVLIADA